MVRAKKPHAFDSRPVKLGLLTAPQFRNGRSPINKFTNHLPVADRFGSSVLSLASDQRAFFSTA